MSLTFAAVHTAARHLAFERFPRDTRGANRPTLGGESYPEALKALTMELFDALPEGRQDDVWASLGRRVDRLNEFLTGREQVASRESTATFESFKGSRIAEGGRRESVTDAIRAVPLAHVVEALTGETILRSGVEQLSNVVDRGLTMIRRRPSPRSSWSRRP